MKVSFYIFFLILILSSCKSHNRFTKLKLELEESKIENETLKRRLKDLRTENEKLVKEKEKYSSLLFETFEERYERLDLSNEGSFANLEKPDLHFNRSYGQSLLIADLVSLLEEFNLDFNYVKETEPNSRISIESNCNQQNLETQLRRDFQDYQFNYNTDSEIFFFDFKKRLYSKFGTDFYLMEIYTINFENSSRIICTVKYFVSVEKRPGRIKRHDCDGDMIGLNRIADLIGICNE